MKKNILYYTSLCSLVFIMALASCEKDKGPVIVKPPPPPIDSTIHYISYQNFIQPLWNDYCIGCHHSNHPFLDLRGIVSYDELLYTGANAPYGDTLDPDNSLLIQRLVGDEWPIMPPDPPYFSQDLIDSVKLWMVQGMRDN